MSMSNSLPTRVQFHTSPEKIPGSIRFFKDCLGAIDGTHIAAFVWEYLVARYRDWKGHLSQNVLAICDFELLFCYILRAWRYKPFPLYDKILELVSGIIATGENVFCPGLSELPQEFLSDIEGNQDLSALPDNSETATEDIPVSLPFYNILSQHGLLTLTFTRKLQTPQPHTVVQSMQHHHPLLKARPKSRLILIQENLNQPQRHLITLSALSKPLRVQWAIPWILVCHLRRGVML